MSAPAVDATSPVTGRRVWPVVARREIAVHLTDRNFIIGTVLSLVTLVAVMGVSIFMNTRSHHYDVAVWTPQAQAQVRAVDAATTSKDAKTFLTPRPVADEGAAQAAVRDGGASAMLTRREGQWVLTGGNSVEEPLQKAFDAAVEQQTMDAAARAAGRSPAEVRRTATVPYTLLDSSEQQAGTVLITSIVFAVLFYMALQLFGMSIANSVVQEKQSRIVEILAASIGVNQLLVGKVVGMIGLAFAQMLLYALVGLIGVSFTSYRDILPTVASGSGWFLVFFLAGFSALATLWAMAGALASRAEDLGQTTSPLVFGGMAVMFAGIYGQGTFLKVASFVPVASSVAMPKRLMMGDASWWQALLALAINVVFAAAAIRFGATVYRRALMQTSGRLTVRQALAATR